MEEGDMGKRRVATKINWADLALVGFATVSNMCDNLVALLQVHSMAIDAERIAKSQRKGFAAEAGYEIEQIAGGG